MAESWGRVINGKKCVSTTDLCDLLNIDKSTLTYWTRDGCPKSDRGWWPIAEVLRWRGLVDSGGLHSEDDAGVINAKHAKMKAEADIKKLAAATAAIRLAELKGKYIPVDDVATTLQRLFVSLKRSFLSVGRQVCNEVAPHVEPVVARRIEKMVNVIVVQGLEQISVNGLYSPPKPVTRKRGRPRKR